MEIKKVKIDELKSPSYNPRDITPAEFEKLKRSLDEFGYVDPLIVNDVNMHIIGGNQRFEALKQLGHDEVEVSFVHIEDINREKALNLRLNKSSGEWDTLKLHEVLEELEIAHFDISLTGFDEFDEEYELKKLTDRIETVSTDEFYENKKEENYDEEYEEEEDIETKNQPSYYEITLRFNSEDEMVEAYDKLVEDGYNCRMSDS